MTKLEAFEKYMSEFATYRGANMQWLMESSSHGRIFDYAWDEATKAEREACAKVCEGWLHADGDQCAEAIRARGEK